MNHFKLTNFSRSIPRRLNSRPSAFGQAGFSLVEMLVVIAIMGIVSAIALPAISEMGSNSRAAKDRRNAQQFAVISSTLAAIGETHVIPESLGGVEATCKVLRKGVTVQAGPLKGEVMGMAGMGDTTLLRSVWYLDVIAEPGELRLDYDPY